MPSTTQICLLAAALAIAGCATPPSASSPVASAPPLPVEVIPSGSPAPVDFRVTENTDRLQVTAIATEAIHDLHTDVHLVGASGKVIATEITITHLAARTRQTVAEFPPAALDRAVRLRIVYHIDAVPPRG